MKGLLKRGFLLSLCKAMESVLGFLFAILLLWKYGSGAYTDALFGATVLSAGIIQMVPTIMSQILIPVLIATDLRPEDHKNFLGSISTLSLAAGALFMAVSLLFPQIILAISSPGLKGDAYSHALSYCVIVAPVFLFTMVVAPLQGILHAERRFFSVELGRLVWKAAPVIAILLNDEAGLLIVAYSFSLGSVLRLIIVVWDFGLRRLDGVRPCLPKRNYFPKQSRQFIGTESLLIAMDWATEIFVRALASTLPIGGLSIFNYTERLCRSLPLQVLAGFGVVLMPELATLSSKRGPAEKKLITQACYIAVAAGVVGGVALFLLAPCITTLVRDFSALENAFLNDFTLSIQMFAPGLAFLLLVMILQSRFYLHNQGKTLMVLGLVQIFSVLVCWVLTDQNAPQWLAISLTCGIAMKGLVSLGITRNQFATY